MVASKLQFKQFSAHVKVDGKALECYSTWVDKRAKHVSCWIASEAGKVSLDARAFPNTFLDASPHSQI
jgi:hypothetical protein